MEPFENALQSGAIWKRCFLKRCFPVWTEKTMLSENGYIIKIETTGCQTTRPWVSRRADRSYHVASISLADILKCACSELILVCALRVKKAFSKRTQRCSVDGRKRYENDKCGRKSFWKRSRRSTELIYIIIWKTLWWSIKKLILLKTENLYR